MSTASAELKTASGKFIKSLHRLESLIAKAADQGHEEKASTVARDIAEGEFKVDIGQFLVNVVAAEYRNCLRNSKDVQLR